MHNGNRVQIKLDPATVPHKPESMWPFNRKLKEKQKREALAASSTKYSKPSTPDKNTPTPGYYDPPMPISAMMMTDGSVSDSSSGDTSSGCSSSCDCGSGGGCGD